MTGLQQRTQQALERIPGLDLRAIAAHTSFAWSSIRNWKCDINTESPRLAREVSAALERFERGELSVSGARLSGAIDIAAIRDPAPKRIRRTGTHYDLAISRDVSTALDYAADNDLIVLITAVYGAGKSEAVAWWRRSHKGDSLALELDAFSERSRCAFLADLGEAIGAKVRGGMVNGARDFRTVTERLAEEPLLLIFDQCEGLTLPVAQMIRQLWDRTRDRGVAIALLGAPVLYERLMRSRATGLGALTSRIGLVANLPGLLRAEMPAVIRAEGVQAEIEDQAVNLWFACLEGSTRRLMASIDLFKAKPPKRITEQVVMDMAAHLWGFRRSDHR